MPRNIKYSFLSPKVIEKMENMSISPSLSNVPSNTKFTTSNILFNAPSNAPSNQQCPVNSVIDTSDESPNPIEKPCKCVGKNKWIQIDGAC
jgi:hypothetical protein